MQSAIENESSYKNVKYAHASKALEDSMYRFAHIHRIL